MKKTIVMTIALLCASPFVGWGAGAWAQTSVNSESSLRNAITNGVENIQLTANIQLENYLNINGKTVTIDLNGHSLSRNLSEYASNGHIFWVHANDNNIGGHLTIKDSSTDKKGSIEGGNATNGGGINVWPDCSLTVNDITFKNNHAGQSGGAIFVRENATANISNASFTGNSAGDHGGAIWNRGTVRATNCSFENNSANDVGALYNAVLTENNVTYAGTATLTGCTFTGNSSTTGAGALANALGNTEMTIKNCTITDNSAGGHGGGIWNGGTLTVDGSTFENNTANDVGGIYNAVSTDGTIAGTATLTGCTLKDNSSTSGAGALANAVGATVMNIENCTIQDNKAGSRGGGIWNGGTLNVKGKVIVTDNKKSGDIDSNVFLKSGKVITLTGELTTLSEDPTDDSHIGVEMESASGGTFTSGYSTYYNGIAPGVFFTADLSIIATLGLDNNKEACMTVASSVYYVERTWDETDNIVFSTMEKLTGSMIAYADEPDEGDYKEVTNPPADKPKEWFGMGGYNDNVAEYYVVSENVERETIVVQGSNVHLILCDGTTLTLTGGLKLEGENKLYIHSQSYGGNMGRLIVTNEYESAAGIGSAWDRVNGELIEKKAGELVIYGGHIEVTGGKYGAGIGSCQRRPHKHDDICNRVTVYGGYVEATGGEDAAGIGGGAGSNLAAVDAGTFTLYDGTVVAQGGNGAAGVGGGGGHAPTSGDIQGGWGGTVNIYGGELTATGGDYGAGIGSAGFAYTLPRNPVTKVNIYNGKVTANGGKNAAGIGSGDGNLPPGTDVCIYNGTVIANGGEHGAGIGGGDEGMGGTLKVLDGTVIATGGIGAAGIGGGFQGMCYFDGAQEDKVYIAGGTVIAKAGEQGGGDNRAFGPGKNCNRANGPLKIGDNMMVGAGNNGTVQKYFPANERKKACWYNSYAEVSPCTHSGSTYTMTEDTHTRQCNYCAATKAEEHDFVDGKCTVCNYETDKTLYAAFYLPDLESSEYRYKDAETYYLAPGSTFSLPVCEVIPPGYEFVGWVAGTKGLHGTYLPRYDLNEDPLPALSEYTLTINMTFTARYRELDVDLYNNQFNGETLYTYNGLKTTSVTLTGRTLYKDGNWNTLCLPFSLTEEQLANSPIAGGDFRTLRSASFSDGTLTLNFTDEGAVKSITAGTPYLVKWANGNSITDLTFNGVTIDYTYNPVEKGVVTFSGNFNPVGCSAGDKTMLYLGAGNKLYYPNATMTINAFRAYFQLNNGITAGELADPGNPEQGTQQVRAFVLNFGGEETGILSTTNFTNSSTWYTLDGRKLNGKPTTKGLYINNGRKVVIK